MELAHARQLLTDERDRLDSLLAQRRETGDLDESQQESAGELSSHDQHLGDVATQTFERERDVSVEEGLEAKRDEVDAALQRIESGDYGKCRQCGRPIDDERLEALPATRYCREHAGSGEDVETDGGWEIAQELGGGTDES